MPDVEDDDQSLRLTLSLSPPGGLPFRSSHERPVSSDSMSEEPEKKARRLRSSERSAGSATTGGAAGGGGGGGGGGKQKEDRIVAPYPWATDRRAVGEVVCKRCDGSQTLEVGVESSFAAVNSYFLSHRDTMHDRAPKVWTSPRLLDCSLCLQGDCVKPVVASKKRSINWLFLLLTQTLGLCTLDQLKYFCKHTRRHRTGAKDRVLYLTYVGLLKQLNPSGPYD